MNSEILYSLSGWSIFIVLLCLLYISVECGYRIGRRAGSNFTEQVYKHVSTLESALLILLSLLLGFAFSMAMSRYDSRRASVIQEANDIQTTFLRANLLPETHKKQIKSLILNYLDSRVESSDFTASSPGVKDALAKSVGIQNMLWDTAIAAAQASNDKVSASLFLEALNALIDDHTLRVAAMEAHVPEIIYLLLFLVSILSLGVMGYSSGINQTRLLGLRSVLILLVSATLLVIIDLDRPRRGFIKVSENALFALRDDLKSSVYP